MRNSFKKAIYKLMKENENILLIVVDSGTEECSLVRHDMPDRIIECGISEANAIGIAAGLSSCGFVPVIYGMGAFLAYRAFEFIRDDLCIQNRNVKIIGCGSGVGFNNLGPTHHTTEDISVMTALPNMKVISPATPLEVANVLEIAVNHLGPFYIRFGKAFEKEVYDIAPKLEFGKANIYQEGSDITIISTGSMLSDVIDGAEMLKQKGISTEIINMWTLKPIDAKCIIDSVKKTGKLITVEEHNSYGGLKFLVSDVLSGSDFLYKKEAICFNDEFCTEYGWRQKIRKMYGISAEEIFEKAYGMFKE